MRNFAILSVISIIFISGCYTKFATIEQVLPVEEPKIMVDSTGDTIKVIERVDTIIKNDKETCVWERDILGRPYLRCYDSYYPRDWFFYTNTPWWYRNDPFWYDYERCPRYYRYDPSCGCCRYYKYFRPGNSNWTGSGNSSGTNNSGSSYGNNNGSTRSRSEGIPGPTVQPPQKSSGSTSGSVSPAESTSVIQQPIETQNTKRQRSSGIPEESTVTPPPKTNKETASTDTTEKDSVSIESKPTTPKNETDSSNVSKPQPRRRNSRSW